MRETIILVDDKCDHVQEVSVKALTGEGINRMLRTKRVRFDLIKLYKDGRSITVAMYSPITQAMCGNSSLRGDQNYYASVGGRYLLHDGTGEEMLSVLRPCYTTEQDYRGNTYGSIHVDRYRWM